MPESNYTLKTSRPEIDAISDALAVQYGLLKGEVRLVTVPRSEAQEEFQALDEDARKERMQKLGAVENLLRRIG